MTKSNWKIAQVMAPKGPLGALFEAVQPRGPISSQFVQNQYPITCISNIYYNLIFMQSHVCFSPKVQRASTFTRTTNRKYFGSTPTAVSGVKKSSILLNVIPRQDPSRLLGSKSPAVNIYRANSIPLAPSHSSDQKQKGKEMCSSVIVGKKDQYKKQSGLATSDKVKELNDWADELKRKLIPFLQGFTSVKESNNQVLNKYPPAPPPKQEAPNNNAGTSASAKSKKSYEPMDYSKDFTDYSKFPCLLKPKKPVEPASYTPTPPQQKPSAYFPSSSDYSHPPSAFKKQNPYYPQPSYPSSSYSTTYSSYSSSHYNSPHKRECTNSLRKDDFEIGRKLGNGMFGEVFLVRHKALRFVCAMKILKKSVVREQKVQQQLMRQIKIQFYLQHQNVINLYGFFCDTECVYLLQELCMDGHLFSMLKQKHRFQDADTADIIRQVSIGLDYIHRERIIHRDIKPENIIMHQGVAKICDFGWAVYRANGLRSTFCGTPLYTPPQLLRGEMYDEKFDIWAIGILAYELVVGRFPFRVFCQDDLNRILTDQITFPFSVDVSSEAKNFILSIIRKDPRDRIEIDEILNHPFLRKTFKPSIPIDFKL